MVCARGDEDVADRVGVKQFRGEWVGEGGVKLKGVWSKLQGKRATWIVSRAHLTVDKGVGVVSHGWREVSVGDVSKLGGEQLGAGTVARGVCEEGGLLWDGRSWTRVRY